MNMSLVVNCTMLMNQEIRYAETLLQTFSVYHPRVARSALRFRFNADTIIFAATGNDSGLLNSYPSYA